MSVNPTLPEGTDPVAALRQIQQQLASARYQVLGKDSYRLENRTRDEGARDAERAAGMNLAPIVDAVEVLVDTLRKRLREMDPFGPDGSDPGWYGSVWVCPLPTCQWTHREPSAVSSVNAAEAERVRRILTEHVDDHATKTPLAVAKALVTRMTDWPAHCSGWIAGSDPENPDMCPEYASPGADKCALHDEHAPIAVSLPGGGWTWVQRTPGVVQVPPGLSDEELARVRRGILARADQPETKPRARVAYPPPATEWRYGFPPKGGTTMWRCQRCGTNHEGNPPGCLYCGYTVLDPGHWLAPPADGTEER